MLSVGKTNPSGRTGVAPCGSGAAGYLKTPSVKAVGTLNCAIYLYHVTYAFKHLELCTFVITLN